MNLYEELPRINLLITYTNFSQPFVNSSMSCIISSVGILNSGTHKLLPVLFEITGTPPYFVN